MISLRRKMECYKVEMKKSKRARISEIPNTYTKNCTPTEPARSAPAENNDVTVDKGVASGVLGCPLFVTLF